MKNCRLYSDGQLFPRFCLVPYKKWAALLVGRYRDRFPVVSLDFSVTCFFLPYHGLEIDSAPSENEYQEHFLRVKAAGDWGWRPHHRQVPNVMEIWEPKTPGTLWATPGLLRDWFSFFYLTKKKLLLLRELIPARYENISRIPCNVCYFSELCVTLVNCLLL